MAEYDLVIIGGGAGGFAGAIKASELGARVAIIVSKRLPLGGTCVNVGCVPSKFLINAAEMYYNAGNNPFQGININKGKIELNKLVKQKNDLVQKFRKDKYINVIKALPNINFFEGNAKFLSKNEVIIDNKKKIRGHNFLIATGSRAVIPKIKGIDKVKVLTNVEALELKKVPKRLVVIGGGFIGIELGQAFSHLGSKVTIIQSNERLLPREEPQISQAIKFYLQEEGINVFTKANVKEIISKDSKKVVVTELGKKIIRVECDELLVATGRAANTEELNLENIGVKVDEKDRIIVDEELKTSALNVWAAGDCTNMIMLETVAARSGAIAAQNAIKKLGLKLYTNAIPSVVFSTPNIASVGLTEEEIQAKRIQCSCRVLSMTSVAKAWLFGDTRGFIKININAKNRQILGVHMVGVLAAEVISWASMAVRMGLTLDDIINTTSVFPTINEALKLCAQSFDRDLSKMSCCVE